MTSIVTCPTDVVAASAERVWDLLTRPERIAEWTGAKLIEGPHRAVEVGDRLVFGPGLGMTVVFEILRMEAPRELTLDVRLPFGVVNHEVLQILPLHNGHCRVTYN